MLTIVDLAMQLSFKNLCNDIFLSFNNSLSLIVNASFIQAPATVPFHEIGFAKALIFALKYAILIMPN